MTQTRTLPGCAGETAVRAPCIRVSAVTARRLPAEPLSRRAFKFPPDPAPEGPGAGQCFESYGPAGGRFGRYIDLILLAFFCLSVRGHEQLQFQAAVGVLRLVSKVSAIRGVACIDSAGEEAAPCAVCAIFCSTSCAFRGIESQGKSTDEGGVQEHASVAL